MGVRARKIALYAKLCGYAVGVFVPPLFLSVKAVLLLVQICCVRQIVLWSGASGHYDGTYGGKI